MTRYATTNALAPIVSRVVQASLPDVLQQLLTDEIAAIPVNNTITDLTLAGTGQGQIFACTLEYAADADIESGGLTSAQVRCYMASQREALAAARQSVIPPSAPQVDSQVAGGSSGARFMGLLVYGDLAGGGPGPQGPQGPQGGDGAQGPQGPQGPEGDENVLRQLSFQPNGVASPGVYISWAALMADVAAQPNYPVRVTLDGSQDGGAVTIPAGAHAFPPGSELIGAPFTVGGSPVDVTCAGTLTGIQRLSYMNFHGPGTVFTFSAGGLSVFELVACAIWSDDPGPLILANGGGFLQLSVTRSQIANFGFPVVQVANITSLELVLSAGYVSENTIAGTATETVNARLLDRESEYLPTQTAYLGDATLQYPASTIYYRTEAAVGTTDQVFLGVNGGFATVLGLDAEFQSEGGGYLPEMRVTGTVNTSVTWRLYIAGIAVESVVQAVAPGAFGNVNFRTRFNSDNRVAVSAQAADDTVVLAADARYYFQSNNSLFN